MSNNKRIADSVEVPAQKKQRNIVDVWKTINEFKPILDFYGTDEQKTSLARFIEKVTDNADLFFPRRFNLLPSPGPRDTIFDMVIAGSGHGRELSGVCKEWRQYFISNEEKRLQSFLDATSKRELLLIFMIWMLEKSIIHSFKVRFSRDGYRVDFGFLIEIWFAADHTYQGEIYNFEDTAEETLHLLGFGGYMDNTVDVPVKQLYLLFRKYSECLDLEFEMEMDLIERNMENHIPLIEKLHGGTFSYNSNECLTLVKHGLLDESISRAKEFLPEINKVLDLY